MMASYSLRQNADGTITLRVGRYRETVSSAGRTTRELADDLRWRAITAGVRVEQRAIEHQLRELR